MSAETDTAADVLAALATPLGGALAAIPGAGPILGPSVAAAMGLVADLLRAGDDPAIVITRIRHSPELISRARAEARWSNRLDEQHPPPPRDTEPTMPSRSDTEPAMPVVTESEAARVIAANEDEDEPEDIFWRLHKPNGED